MCGGGGAANSGRSSASELCSVHTGTLPTARPGVNIHVLRMRGPMSPYAASTRAWTVCYIRHTRWCPLPPGQLEEAAGVRRPVPVPGVGADVASGERRPGPESAWRGRYSPVRGGRGNPVPFRLSSSRRPGTFDSRLRGSRCRDSRRMGFRCPQFRVMEFRRPELRWRLWARIWRLRDFRCSREEACQEGRPTCDFDRSRSSEAAPRARPDPCRDLLHGIPRNDDHESSP